ncbi:hypothetical protein GW17_00028799 [Ensete ventricosum]|nr:hypothetical protein GW17_00028799 [Ensete ventricosum]
MGLRDSNRLRSRACGDADGDYSLYRCETPADLEVRFSATEFGTSFRNAGGGSFSAQPLIFLLVADFSSKICIFVLSASSYYVLLRERFVSKFRICSYI